MSIYQNTFFDFEIKFAESWKIRSWKNWKKAPKNIERFQTSDKDLPHSEGKSKTLFRAIEMVKEGPNLISKQIYIDAVWSDKNLDIENLFPKREYEILRTSANESILEKECQSFIRVFDINKNNLYHQFFLIKSIQNIWLYVSVVGDTKNNFESAKEQLLKISKLK